MDSIRVRELVATSRPIEKYKGVCLGVNVLQQMAERINSQQVIFRYDHDLKRPGSATSFRGEVIKSNDSQHELWMEFDVDKAEWLQFQNELKEGDFQGGMSFSVTEPYGFVGEPPYDLMIAVDANLFNHDAIVEALENSDIPRSSRIQTARLYQCSAADTLQFLIELGTQTLLSLPGGVLASYLWQLLSRLISNTEVGSNVVIQMRSAKGAEVRIEGNNPRAIKSALKGVKNILNTSNNHSFWDADNEEWHEVLPAVSAPMNPQSETSHEIPRSGDQSDDAS